MKPLIVFIISFFALALQGRAQEPVKPPPPPQPVTVVPNTDPDKRIDFIPYSRQLTIQEVNDSTRLYIIAGNVKLKQGGTLFYCDSCVLNNRTKVFEAWGNVHINQADTQHIYSGHLIYKAETKEAYLDKNVRLTDGTATLTTPDLDYNLMTNVGIYKKGGKVVNKKSVLTSTEGWYYADRKDVYFKKNVLLKDPAQQVVTDSLLYNLESGVLRFIAQTKVVDSGGRTINTREGYYDQRTGKAEFDMRPEIIDGDMHIIANRIATSDSVYQAEGNAIVRDLKNKSTILAGLIFQNRKTEAIFATHKPLLIIEKDKDSIFVSAESFYSAKIIPDSLIKKTSKKTTDTAKTQATDSLKQQLVITADNNRYFEAIRNVRIFNDSLQAVCDSLYYSYLDSTFKLYTDPVVWAQQTQIFGDTIFLYTQNQKPQKVEVYENSFMANHIEGEVYNQIKSSRMNGHFINGDITWVNALGLAECIYFIQDDDSAYIGVNQNSCDIIDIYFENRELEKIVFRNEVPGTLYPISEKKPIDLRLPNFKWLENRRPKTKLEMYE